MLFSVIACMLGVATKYCQSEKTIVVTSSIMKAPDTVIIRNSLINKLGTFNGFSK